MGQQWVAFQAVFRHVEGGREVSLLQWTYARCSKGEDMGWVKRRVGSLVRREGGGKDLPGGLKWIRQELYLADVQACGNRKDAIQMCLRCMVGMMVGQGFRKMLDNSTVVKPDTGVRIVMMLET